MKKNEAMLSGEVKKLLYQNEENGYTVCLLAGEDGGEYTLTGTMPALCVGERLRARAVSSRHALYGEQWRVTEFEKDLPADEAAIVRYLSSRAIRGIGPKLAARIVERFGTDTLSIMEHSPQMLSSVKGVSRALATRIGQSFREQFGLRQVMLFFGGTFGMKTSLAIYRALGSGAVELVRKNPYLLCERVHGIGFVRADALAADIGYKKDSPERVSAGLIYLLREAWQSQGHVFLPQEELFSRAEELLGVSRGALLAEAEELRRAGRLVRVAEALYLPYAYALEEEAARRLLTLSRVRLLYEIPNAGEAIARTEQEEGIRYEDSQREAILAAARHPFTVITGGPGTGKTTITRALVRLFVSLGMKVCLAAPTGRAAKRLSEKSGIEARTLHRVLEMAYVPEGEGGGQTRFARGEDNPLSESVYLVDEVSMVDLELLVCFLRAVPAGSRIVFIGDADQLPSVGAGCVLRDVIDSGAFCVTRLSTVFRQESQSSILRYAHEICAGKTHALQPNEGDLFFLPRQTAAETAETVCDLLVRRLPASYGPAVLEDLQVLSPSRRGACGTAALNAVLQERLNPPAEGKRETRVGQLVFREGDRVMQIKNDYELVTVTQTPSGPVTASGVFNGDVGRIVEVDLTGEQLVVEYEGETRATYPFSALGELEHAWAVTVHKAQGSEYGTVVLALCGVPPMLCRRSLLYTAVTRAKGRLILVGQEELCRRMVKNDAPEERYSALGERLREAAL